MIFTTLDVGQRTGAMKEYYNVYVSVSNNPFDVFSDRACDREDLGAYVLNQFPKHQLKMSRMDLNYWTFH